MFIAATVCWHQHRNPVKIRNMSVTGALVESPVIPPLGSSVLLLRGSFSAAGRVVWIDRNRCGLHLSAAVNVRDWMALPANTEQQRVDQIVALVKAGAIPIPAGSLAERLELPASLTNDRLTEDLGLISQLIDDLGDDLASDPETLMHHGTKLQNLDIAMQMLTAICNALSAEDRGDGSRMARLEDLRTSCGQALGKAARPL
jgi:hypothetical protein